MPSLLSKKKSAVKSLQQSKAKKNKTILSKKDIDFFQTLINTPSPTWFESTGQKVRLEYIKHYVDTSYTDSYGTAVAVINPDAKCKVVIEAHCDEISRFVNYITDDGQIHVIRNGGSDHLIAPSKTVNIRTKDWPVKAVFGWPAIHTRNPSKGQEEQTPKVENITVDCGCLSKEEVEKLGIHVWSVITYSDEFFLLNDRYYVGRAMDNRAGGFMIAQVARLLKESKKALPFGLYIVNSVQEEIGLKGAEMIAYTIDPDIAIVTDVCHDTSTPMIKKNIEGDTRCWKWPVISYGPSVHNLLREHILDVAKKQKIPFQRLASSRRTGTDTDIFAYSRGWRPSALISLPTRYMHTTVEMVHKDDVENAIKLLYHTVCSISPKQKRHYL